MCGFSFVVQELANGIQNHYNHDNTIFFNPNSALLGYLQINRLVRKNLTL